MYLNFINCIQIKICCAKNMNNHWHQCSAVLNCEVLCSSELNNLNIYPIVFVHFSGPGGIWTNFYGVWRVLILKTQTQSSKWNLTFTDEWKKNLLLKLLPNTRKLQCKYALSVFRDMNAADSTITPSVRSSVKRDRTTYLWPLASSCVSWTAWATRCLLLFSFSTFSSDWTLCSEARRHTQGWFQSFKTSKLNSLLFCLHSNEVIWYII